MCAGAYPFYSGNHHKRNGDDHLLMLAMLPLKLTIHDRSLAINYDGTTGIVYGSTTVLRYLRGLGW
jgi:hypothetical protein|eukprot:COSAG02_NODE_352_length_24036_cov_20.479258_2_plen_66_part_00